MKSNKQRRLEIKAIRRKRKELKSGYPLGGINYRPLNCIEADTYALEHNASMTPLPRYYVDKPFKCRDCGSHEIWTATSQKWWYEVAKGYIDSTAVRCKECRKRLRLKKEQQKQQMEIMAQRVTHPNESFFRKRYRKK